MNILKQGLSLSGGGLDEAELEAINRIPHARGMGSSAAAIVAAYAAADALLPAAERGGLDAVFQAAAAWEGHPDNVAPAVYGGLSISATMPAKPLGEPLLSLRRRLVTTLRTVCSTR